MGTGKQIVGTALTRVVGIGMMIAASALMARALGPEKRGIVGYLVLMPSVGVTLFSFGFSSTWTVFLARKKEGRLRLLGTARTLTILPITLCVAFVLAWLALDMRRTLEHYRAAALLTLLVPVVTILSNTWRAFLLGLMRIAAANLADLCGRGLYLVAVVVLFVLGQLDVTQAILLTILLHGATSLACMVFLPPRRWPVFDTEAAQGVLRFSGWMYLGQITSFMLYYGDQMLIIWMVGDAALGLYAVAVVVVQQLWLLSQVTAQINLPLAAGRGEAETDRTPALARLNCLALVVGTCTLAAVAHPLVEIVYGSPYAHTAWLIIGLLPGIFFLGVGKVLASDLVAQGRLRMNCFSSMAALVINVILNLLLIPRWGALGAAVATSVAYSLLFLLLAWDYRRQSGYSYREFLCPRREDLALMRSAIRRRGASE